MAEAVVEMPKIVAKLHLAALMPIKAEVYGNESNPGFIVNTGIVNDDPDRTPEDIGKVTFNFENPSEQYEVGYVVKIDAKKSFYTDKLVHDIDALIADASHSQSMADKTSFASSDAVQQLKAFIETTAKQLSDELSGDGFDYGKELSAWKSYSEDPGKLGDLKKEMVDWGKKCTEKIDDDYQADLDKWKLSAASILQQYMEVFSGKENIETKITKDNIAYLMVSPNAVKSTYEGLVKDFKIQSITNGEYAVLMSKQAAPGKETDKAKAAQIYNYEARICFRVAYTLNQT